MIILLSSNKNILKQYIPPGSTVGFIPTASEPDDDRWYMEKDREDLKQMNYELVSINITQEPKSTILNKLNAIDALFVAGGNSFYLLQELQKKDLLKELANFAHNKTYVGSSAGACIACPSIDYAEKLDDKSRAPHLHDCAAMNIVNFFILPHYGNKEKYTKLRALVAEDDCPAIVYVSRTKRCKTLAAKLTRDGYRALPFHGKMESDVKIAYQDAFMNGKVNIMVATSAFGMGVDKKDVGLVIHYDISDSLENYVQEAGRAGRDPHVNAKCYVLYSDSDLDKHFIRLNQTKLSLSEIQQVWRAIKKLSGKYCSCADNPADVRCAGTVNRSIHIVCTPRSEIRDGPPFGCADNSVRFCGDERLVVYFQEERRFNQLSIQERCNNRNQRFIGINDGALRHSVDVSVEAIIPEIVQKFL